MKEPDKQGFLNQVQALDPRLRLSTIERAYDLVEIKHREQKRKSGEAYICHLTEVACIVAGMRLDTTSVTAALLHDVVEDTDMSVDELRLQFGPQVALIVDGLSKISDMKVKMYNDKRYVAPEKLSPKAAEEETTDSKTLTYQDKQANYIRRLLVAVAEDPRVIFIKLADRLHNMRTLQFHDEEKRRRIAQETLDIYAPLAHRFGLAEMKWELEDICFKFLNRDEYSYIKSQLELKRPQRELHVAEIKQHVQEMMLRNKIEGEVVGRPKHIYSIHKKMKRKHKNFAELEDLYAVRIIIGTKKSFLQDYLETNHIKEKKDVPIEILNEIKLRDDERAQLEKNQIYLLLGHIHSTFDPISGAFDDYVAQPKQNGYQSLHTTVMGLHGKIEIQIRSYDMHRIAEMGIAAHWRYKEGGNQDNYFDKLVPWVRDLLQNAEYAENAEEFIEFLKADLITRRIVVYTPKGDALHLQNESTPLDFAFAIHTEVGNHCRGALVNGQMVHLSHRLKKGDKVEILTAPTAKPKKSWFAWIASAKAKAKIRKSLNDQAYQTNVQIGRKRLMQELKHKHVDIPSEKKLTEIAKSYHHKLPDDMFAAIALNRISLIAILKKHFPQAIIADKKHDASLDEKLKQVKEQKPVVIDGISRMEIRMASCCNPKTGDDVIGYITRTKGVSVHLKKCPNILDLYQTNPERLMNLNWGEKARPNRILRKVYRPQIHVEGKAIFGMLNLVTQAIASVHIDIYENKTTPKAGKFKGDFVLDLQDLTKVPDVIQTVRQIEGIEKVKWINELKPPVASKSRKSA